MLCACCWVRWGLASGIVSGPGAVGVGLRFRWVGRGRSRWGFGGAVHAQYTVFLFFGNYSLWFMFSCICSHVVTFV